MRYACARVEDSREDKLFDRALDVLSVALAVQISANGATILGRTRQESLSQIPPLDASSPIAKEPKMTSPDPASRRAAKKEQAETRRITAAADRLLQQLAGEGAFAVAGDLSGPGSLDVFAKRKGVSLRVASATREIADILVRDDLAAWRRGAQSDRRYLTISEAGRARLARRERSDGLQAFASQHIVTEQAEVNVGGAAIQVTTDTGESPLAWLARRKGVKGRPLLDEAQIEAGERFRRDLELAQIMPRITANWSAAVSTSGRGESSQNFTDTMIAARQRIDRAIESVGSDCAGLLIDVCGFLKSLRTVEFERAWPQRSAKIALAIALSMLARHYGLSPAATGRGRAETVHWGAADYRPAISTPQSSPGA